MTYFKFKVRPPKGTDRQKAVRKLDEAHSEYTRLRDSDEDGMVVCITCGDNTIGLQIDCGHFVKRGNSSVRWELINSHGQCRLCNSTHDGKEDLHAEAIDKLYGEGTAEQLRRRGAEDEKFMAYELEAMTKELRKEIRALKIEKGMI
jgi:hypothetical protein